MTTEVEARPYLSRESAYFTLFGDVRGLFLGPRNLAMQVAHPQVGAAVSQFSTYQDDPWGRLYNTMLSLFRYTFGTEAQAAAEKERLDGIHRSINGRDGQGRRFSGMNPQARLWVHATSFEVFAVAGSVTATLDRVDREAAYEDWKRIGTMLGIPDRDLPATVRDFDIYCADTIANVLEYNDAVADVLHMATHLPPPPWLPLPAPLWRLGMFAPTAVVRLYTAATLPPELRRRFGIRWTALDKRRFQAASILMREVGDRLPTRARYLPVANDVATRMARLVKAR